MAVIVNDADIALQLTSPRIIPVTLGTNLIVPAIKSIQLTAPTLIFQVTAAGVPTPSSILLTAALKQVTGTISFSVTAGTATLTSVTSTTATLLYANMATDSVTIRASVTENSITYTSDITIVKAHDGATGTPGTNGSNGTNGTAARTAYLVQSQALSAPAVTPNPSTGPTSLPTGWTSTFSAPGAGQSLWAIDGLYDTPTNQITWSTPYLTQGFTTTIQSDNFVATSTGWRIKRDTGDVEFNNGTFRGNISAGANIDVTGTGRFNGSYTTGGAAYAVAANDNSSNSRSGVYGKGWGFSTSSGVVGEDTNAGVGVQGIGGVGVVGLPDATVGAAGYGAKFFNSYGGGALWLSAGTFKWNTYVYALPLGTGTKFLCDDSNWVNLTNVIVYVSTGAAPGGSMIGSVVVDTLGLLGQIRLGYFAV